jgi:hypothetical protein
MLVTENIVTKNKRSQILSSEYITEAQYSISKNIIATPHKEAELEKLFHLFVTKATFSLRYLFFLRHF